MRKAKPHPTDTQPPAYSRLPVRGAGSEVFSNQAWNEIGRSLKLSGRELQIVRGMFDDGKECAIAADLGISKRTVHTHVERLYRKLVISDRPQLIVHVLKEFLTLTLTPGSGLPPICSNQAAGRCPIHFQE